MVKIALKYKNILRNLSTALTGQNVSLARRPVNDRLLEKGFEGIPSQNKSLN